jgi:hypothetical protein
MPYYYKVNRQATTNGSGATESQHLRAATVANQALARIMAIYLAARSGTAGGILARVKQFATIGSGGTATTPSKSNALDRAADTTWFNDATALTPGTSTNSPGTSVGAPQTGGQGGWMPPEADGAYTLQPNGAGNGNFELYSIANGTSVPVDVGAEFKEG